MSRTYCIIDASDVSSVDFSQVYETSADTLRYNADGDQTFVKYTGNKPRFLYGKTTYTHSQILDIHSTSDWNPPYTPPESDE